MQPKALLALNKQLLGITSANRKGESIIIIIGVPLEFVILVVLCFDQQF
jgi:hypothetical protein